MEGGAADRNHGGEGQGGTHTTGNHRGEGGYHGVGGGRRGLAALHHIYRYVYLLKSIYRPTKFSQCNISISQGNPKPSDISRAFFDTYSDYLLCVDRPSCMYVCMYVSMQELDLRRIFRYQSTEFHPQCVF